MTIICWLLTSTGNWSPGPTPTGTVAMYASVPRRFGALTTMRSPVRTPGGQRTMSWCPPASTGNSCPGRTPRYRDVELLILPPARVARDRVCARGHRVRLPRLDDCRRPAVEAKMLLEIPREARSTRQKARGALSCHP